jgi:hypothetical protein
VRDYGNRGKTVSGAALDWSGGRENGTTVRYTGIHQHTLEFNNLPVGASPLWRRGKSFEPFDDNLTITGPHHERSNTTICPFPANDARQC